MTTGWRRRSRFFGDGRELRAPVAAHEQRLGARAEDAVSSLELRPVDGEVGLVDELVRVGTVLGIGGDAEGDRRADRLARRLDLKDSLGNGSADALGDLERLLGRRLGQQDGELLSAEAGRDVVMAKLLAEDLGDARAGRRRRRGARRRC